MFRHGITYVHMKMNFVAMPESTVTDKMFILKEKLSMALSSNNIYFVGILQLEGIVIIAFTIISMPSCHLTA